MVQGEGGVTRGRHDMRQARRLCAALILVAGLAGCAAQVPVDRALAARPAGEILAGCCDTEETYPDWLIRLADANVEPLRRVGLIQLRPGRLTRQPEAVALLKDALRPMDVVFFHSQNRVSGLLIPGQFTHGAIYIGTEAQLRQAGLWHLPALDPWRDHIRQGNIYLEAVDGGVRLIGADVVLDTDAVVALRPRGPNRGWALRRGLATIGTPFDMHFDSTDPSALFCSELIARMYVEADFPRSPVSGRETILPDAIVAEVLTGDLPFGLVGYVVATRGGGARVETVQNLAWDIRSVWPHTRLGQDG
ncbi:YiiX/YebB-like N1pC/P60 family cysteine hydrolase [Antarctobacter jejuensis]|uniref:YiiX/YebB-like N1pC/P60 family cysteine hydrolase n=1 Tax=Antarctobacter jejuensis TaxID=1439938 RepID=UPI003FCF252C